MHRVIEVDREEDINRPKASLIDSMSNTHLTRLAGPKLALYERYLIYLLFAFLCDIWTSL